MGLIQNFDSLAKTPQRKVVLDLIETGLHAIAPEEVMKSAIFLRDSILTINTQEFNLKEFNQVFLIGFGKGSGGIAKVLEDTLGNYLTQGYVIDNVPQTFSKINFTLGTHPLPSETNIAFTNTVLENIHDLTPQDLVLIVICGGGSAMFESPYKLELTELTKVFDSLLKSGATISEMNVIRKHLSQVKGGGLAKHLYPATVGSLLFSDVPGSTLSVIASGTTVHETSTMDDVQAILKKYPLPEDLKLSSDVFSKLPQEEKYFKRVFNMLIISNKTALIAMVEKAKILGYKTILYSDRLQGDAKELGKVLLSKAQPKTILFAGGESTIHVKGTGKGGRNQTLILASLPYIKEGEVIVSVDTDGVDFYHFAGAIGDIHTRETANKMKLDPTHYLDDDNSYQFFSETGDGIYTGNLESNVSDIFIVLKD